MIICNAPATTSPSKLPNQLDTGFGPCYNVVLRGTNMPYPGQVFEDPDYYEDDDFYEDDHLYEADLDDLDEEYSPFDTINS